MSRRRYFRSDSSPEIDHREKIKDYFRKFVAFMCSQVGVAALVVCYTLIGAVGFSRIEAKYNDTTFIDKVSDIRSNYTGQLWRIAHKHNVLNETAFIFDTNEKLKGFQNEMVVIIKKGYNGRDAGQLWTFPAALMFSLSTITMIGYGNLVPRTSWGKFATVIYAVFGIPLYVLYFLNMGEILAGCFKWIYTKIYECSTTRTEKIHKRIVVPTTACLWVMGGYVLIGAIMFAEWEQWTYLDSAYFCVTSLCKLGLGDFVPGTASQDGNESKLVINFIYILVGLGLVAMCYNLMREEVRVKVDEFREDFRQCLEDTRVRILECCRKYRQKY